MPARRWRSDAEGIPLGLLQIQYDAPDVQAHRGRPLVERKTFRWIRGLRDCAEVAGQLAGPRLVAVMDREADVQALFAEQRRLEGVELLVRAKHNRSLGKDVPKLFEHMRAQPVGGQLEIKVQRSSARRGTRRQSASALRAARTAQAELRWQTVECRPRRAARQRCGCSWCTCGSGRRRRGWKRWSGSC